MKRILLVLLALSLAGCKTRPPAVAPSLPVSDAAYEHLMNKATDAAGRGKYDLAGTLYAQALDRAKVLDRRNEIVRSALCLCAYAINAEDADTADSALKAYREVASADDPTALRAADLALRLAWLKGDDDMLAVRQLEKAVSSGKTGELDYEDAALTLAESALRRGHDAEIRDPAALPFTLQARAHSLLAWKKKNADAWLAASREYAILGNDAAAFREALRCAKTLHSPEAARVALRMAEGLHDAARQKTASGVLEKVTGVKGTQK
jgi:hypothetical protein